MMGVGGEDEKGRHTVPTLDGPQTDLAFNAGVEAVLDLARKHRAERRARKRIGVMTAGMLGAFSIIIEDGECLLRNTNDAGALE